MMYGKGEYGGKSQSDIEPNVIRALGFIDAQLVRCAVNRLTLAATAKTYR